MKEQYIKPTAKLANRISRLYPDLTYSSSVVVPDSSNQIIDDVGLTPQQRLRIEQSIEKDLIFLEPSELTSNIPTDFTKAQLIIFPLNGGKQVKKYLSLNTNTPTTIVKVSRDPSDIIFGRIMGNSDQMMEAIIDQKPDIITVVDDVCVTSSTFQEIKKEVESKLNQSLYWILSVWLMSVPNRSNIFPSGVYGAKKVDAAQIYTKQSGGNAPLNSLSNWFFDEEKGPIVLQNYAQKYCPKLVKTISDIRSQL